jgi:hypothetical protein
MLATASVSRLRIVVARKSGAKTGNCARCRWGCAICRWRFEEEIPDPVRTLYRWGPVFFGISDCHVEIPHGQAPRQPVEVDGRRSIAMIAVPTLLTGEQFVTQPRAPARRSSGAYSCANTVRRRQRRVAIRTRATS